MNRSDLRSLALHRAVAEKLRHEPQLWAKVDSTVARMCASAANGLTHPWGLLWRERLLQSPADLVLDFICEDTPLAQQYRSSSPFSGVLTAGQRAAILARTAHEALAA